GGFQPQGGAADPGPPQARTGPCFQIDRIIVTGVTRLPPGLVETLIAPYAPNCMQGADIQSVMRAIDGTYADRGYITSKTYIPGQNLADGTLTLEVVEGTVEGIFIADEAGEIVGRRGERLLGTAFPRVEGEILDLRRFEQGLDQMNRLPSVDATLRLQPGDTPGGSYVIVDRIQKDRFRGLVRFDTLASRSTGRNRLTFDLAADDILGANDTWAASLAGTANTNALTFAGSIPYGANTFELGLSYSEYLSILSPVSELFGTSSTVDLALRRMLRRGQLSTTEGKVSFGYRDGARLVNDTALTPQRLASLNLSLRHIQLGETARNSYDIAIEVGLAAFGATEDPVDPARDQPRAQYQRLLLGWQRQGALGTLGTLVTDVQGQVSPDTLFGSEQMALGSYSTVRGYAEPITSGENGAYLRSDLYLAPDVWTRLLPKAARSAAARRIQPHVFLDMGTVRDRVGGDWGSAAGAGFGLSAQTERFTASGIVGVPLIDSRGKLRSSTPVVQIRLDFKAF
ncbi:MAG: ShlB/FhaC/HecB family hemolysin secretion/activation protein, partial [Jannaschia sp.]